MTMLLVVDLPEQAERDLSVEQSAWGDQLVIRRHVFDGDLEQLASACENANAILTDFAPFPRRVIESLDKCEIISVAATGYNAVDVDAADAHGISVSVVEEYCTEEVADHTLALILSLSRHLPSYHRLVQEHRQWQFDAISGLTRLCDQTLGLIGFGRIGQAVARRAQAFGLTVISYDPNIRPELFAQCGVESCELGTVLARAHILSLHCNLDASNTPMIDTQAFDKMTQIPLLINVARGELVDEDALVTALNRGKIAGAGLDVLSSESPNLATSSLLNRENVVLTPHAAFYSDRSIQECRMVSARNIHFHLNGKYDLVTRYVTARRAAP